MGSCPATVRSPKFVTAQATAGLCTFDTGRLCLVGWANIKSVAGGSRRLTQAPVVPGLQPICS